MCGRCRFTLRPEDVPRACHLRDTSVRQVDIHRYRPSYNVSPGSFLPVVRRESGGTEGYTAAIHCMKWGLVPSFTKKDDKPDHFKMFNARSETICEKASFRRLVPNNRCLVAVEGFYEWKKGPKKQPYYIHFKDGRPLVFAALYDSWKNAEGEQGEILYTFTILTTDSSTSLQWLHDRMPVILGDEPSIDAWLNGTSDSKFGKMLKPYEKSDLTWYPVTPAMNKSSFDSPECIKEIPLKSEEQSSPITKFFSKKGTHNDKEPDKSVKRSPEKSVNVDDMLGIIEEESKMSISLKHSSSTEKEGSEPKFNDFAHSPSTNLKVEAKREYEQILDDSKPRNDKHEKVLETPVKRAKSGTEKQASLRSYFGRS